MDFIFLTLGMVGFIVLVLVLLARAYPGSGADLVDWRPTRSYEDEARLETEDIQQMIEAQNEMRRRRGERELTRADAARMAQEDEAIRERQRRSDDDGSRRRGRARRLDGRPSLARALIVGCGCRGQAAGQAPGRRRMAGLAGPRRDPGNAEDILAARLEAVVADPDRVGSILDHVGDVTLVFWLLGSADGRARGRSPPSTARGWSA